MRWSDPSGPWSRQLVVARCQVSESRDEQRSECDWNYPIWQNTTTVAEVNHSPMCALVSGKRRLLLGAFPRTELRQQLPGTLSPPRPSAGQHPGPTRGSSTHPPWLRPRRDHASPSTAPLSRSLCMWLFFSHRSLHTLLTSWHSSRSVASFAPPTSELKSQAAGRCLHTCSGHNFCLRNVVVAATVCLFWCVIRFFPKSKSNDWATAGYAFHLSIIFQLLLQLVKIETITFWDFKNWMYIDKCINRVRVRVIYFNYKCSAMNCN